MVPDNLTSEELLALMRENPTARAAIFDAMENTEAYEDGGSVSEMFDGLLGDDADDDDEEGNEEDDVGETD
jgi:hypothetical protein